MTRIDGSVLDRMRSAVLLPAMLGCLGCRPSPALPVAAPEPDRSAEIAPLRGLPTLPDALVFVLDLAHTELTVVDVEPGEDGLDRARRAAGASVVINAGFFDPAFRPEGLVVSDGVETSPLVPSMSGGVLSITQGLPRLDATETYVSNPSSAFAVQCRPRLVVSGARNIASENGRRAARTALCIGPEPGIAPEPGIGPEPGTLELIVVPAAHDGGPTLYELADALVAHGCSEALNLDGGPSTGVVWHDPVGRSAIGPRGPVRQAIAARLY